MPKNIDLGDLVWSLIDMTITTTAQEFCDGVGQQEAVADLWEIVAEKAAARASFTRELLDNPEVGLEADRPKPQSANVVWLVPRDDEKGGEST